jgi:hypothetical protein
VRASFVLLRNVVRVEDVPDPVEVVEAILERTPAERVQTIYGVPPFADARELLTMLALTFGRLLKACALRSVPPIIMLIETQGGTPDILAAARIVLHDWNAQKTPAPVRGRGHRDGAGAASGGTRTMRTARADGGCKQRTRTVCMRAQKHARRQRLRVCGYDG